MALDQPQPSASFRRGFPSGRFLHPFFQGASLSYAEKHLIAGETVHYETRLHWIVMVGHALIAAVLVLVGAAVLLVPANAVNSGTVSYSGALRWAGIGCFLAAAVFFGIGLVRRNAT